MDKFLEKLEALMQAQADVAYKAASCDSDASYWLSKEFQKVEDLKKEFLEEFNTAVDLRVARALEAAGVKVQNAD